MTYDLHKKCEKCQVDIPDDFNNLLCYECYNKSVEPIVEEPKPIVVEQPIQTDTDYNKNGITNPNYKENPEAPDKEQWEANITLFRRNGVMLFKPTRQMYTFIRDYCLNGITQHPQYPKFIWKPKIVDVGCGCGVGSNTLSLEADMVWGIDKNLSSVRFAKECFERTKNQIYYSSQVTFDQIDIMKDTREFAKFDLVVAIEIIEHIDDYKGFLSTLINKFGKAGTEYFISTPNRNNRTILDNFPRNKYHVREWQANEFHNVLKEYFKNITFYTAAGVEIAKEDMDKTDHTPLLARCSL
jgi:2-polyprenyl-3-methyl-5-hydroxy-6-metoxy-1,4-benzoquinol methylase